MIQQAVILAGGLGTRLGALTGDVPKPLVPVAGRPFLDWLLGEVRRHGIQRIVLIGGHRGEVLRQAYADATDVAVLVEPEPRGTGGALHQAADLLDDRFLLMNGDSLFDVNLTDLARPSDALATLAVRRVADGSRYGALDLTADRITRFAERPDGPGPALINGGVAAVSRGILDRIPATRAVSIEREVYPALAREGLLGGRLYDGGFIDIGVPDDLARAQTVVPDMLCRAAVIFDRDGTLNVDVGHAHRPDQIAWMPGAIRAVKAVNDAGLLAFVATNQAGVARGLYGEAGVVALHAWMNAELARHGAHIDGFAYCPHHPDFTGVCDCRKPAPGMLRDLVARFDVRGAIMVGDQPSDMAAAAAADIPGIRYAGGDLHALIAPMLGMLSNRGRSRIASDSAIMM